VSQAKGASTPAQDTCPCAGWAASACINSDSDKLLLELVSKLMVLKDAGLERREDSSENSAKDPWVKGAVVWVEPTVDAH